MVLNIVKLLKKLFFTVWSWKLGREKQLTNAAVTAINRVIANVPVLDDRYYETRDHSNQGCFYYPEPEAGKPVVFPGQCDPGIQAAANFNMTAFQGIWHEIETYPKEQQSGQCINHRYTLGTANYLNLVSSNVIDEILGVTNSRVTFASAQDSSGRLVINLTSGGTSEFKYVITTLFRSR
ncbi:jg11476 [Pararge aegeria aegeria]|uniref:Jg11476 protein n=1 Tax=Pararge aegeria aegeria TaxID=348720 RepID=A0A8S4QJN1_9NEOP|nr:jg11476 [Pararge aegeria aegeria]